VCSWQSGRDPYAPRPTDRLVVYVSKARQEAGIVPRIRDHARRVDRSPSAVVLTACEQFLAQQRSGNKR